MKIKRLSIDSFGKFSNKEINFSDGINVIKGRNESGKTTAQQFIVNSLYGFFKRDVKGRRTIESYEQYQPWNNPNRFSGKITLEKDGKEYTINRNFLKSRPSVQVFSESQEDITDEFEYNDSLRLPDPAPQLVGLSRTAFENTLCVSQRQCAAASSLENELSEKLSSISQSADTDISVVAANSYLDKKLAEIGTEKRNSPYKTLCLKITELENELDEARKAENDFFVLKENKVVIENRKIELKNSIAEIERKIDALHTSAEIKKLARANKLASEIRQNHAKMQELIPYSQMDIASITETFKKLEALKNLRSIDEKRRSRLEELRAMRVQSLSELSELELKTDFSSVLDAFDRNYGDALRYFEIANEVRELEDALDKQDISDSYDTLIKSFDDLQIEKSAILSKKKQKLTLIIIATIVIILGICLSFAKLPLLAVSAAGAVILVFAMLINSDTASIDRKIERLLTENGIEKNSSRDKLIEEVTRMKSLSEMRKSQLFEKNRGLNAFEDRLNSYFSLLTDCDWKTDLDGILHSVRKAKSLLSNISETDISIKTTTDTVEENGYAIESLTNDISKVFEDCGVVNADGLAICYEKKTAYDNCEMTVQSLASELERLLDGMTLQELTDKCKSAEAVEISENEEELKTALNVAYVQSDECIAQLSRVTERLNSISESTRTVGEITAELDLYRAELAEFDAEIESINIAKERLDNISRELHNEFAPALNNAVSDCASFISDGKYSKLRLTRKFELFADTVDCAEPVSANSLSGGTADMVYLAARLALTDFLSDDGELLPMIFDDSFVFLDDSRLAKFLEFISKSGRQILIFTCHPRECNIMKEKGIAFNEIKL